MSTVAEHLAMLELYDALDRREGFYQEAYLFTQVHWRDLLALIPATDMDMARSEIEQSIHVQHPEKAAELIARWRAGQGKPAT